MTGFLAALSISAALRTRSSGAAVVDGWNEARSVDRRERLGQPQLLHLGVEVDVDRRHRRAVGEPVGAQQRLAGGARRGGLVVPFGEVAHDRALVARGVDPVDPRTALDRIDRAGGAEHHHRHAVAPGIEHRHGGVEQADVGMDRGRHRAAGHLGVAVGDRHSGLLMQAQEHLRRLVAEVVDDRVVQAAIARAGIECDIGNVEGAQRIGHDVAAEARRIGAGRDRPFKGAGRDGSGVAGARGGGAGRIGRRHPCFLVLEPGSRAASARIRNFASLRGIL